MARLIFTILAWCLTIVPLHADFTITPLRTVINQNSPEARFTISNPTPRIIEGRATWVDFAITKSGYRPATPEERANISAAPWLTLKPATFQLEPGERIDIVVSLKGGASPPPNERRSHLLIETEAARTLLRKASDNGGLQVDIGAGVSMPVFLRRTEGKANASIINTRLLRDKDGLLFLSTAIEQSGAYSTFGRLEATFKPRGATEMRVLAIRDNVVGFKDSNERHYNLPLGEFSLGNGELTLRYLGTDEFEGRLFDKKRFDIAPADSHTD